MTIESDVHGFEVQAGRPYTSQVVAYSSTTAPSAAFQNTDVAGRYMQDGTPVQGNKTQHIRLCATSDCWIAFGTAPTAVAGAPSMYLPANVPEYFWVNYGEKVAVIRNTADGNLCITELAN